MRSVPLALAEPDPDDHPGTRHVQDDALITIDALVVRPVVISPFAVVAAGHVGFMPFDIRQPLQVEQVSDPPEHDVPALFSPSRGHAGLCGKSYAENGSRDSCKTSSTHLTLL